MENDIHDDITIGIERDAFGAEFGRDRHGQHLFTVVDKYLHAEAVDDQTEFQTAALMIDQGAALVDDRTSGTGEFTVDLERGLKRTEADAGSG